MSEVVVKQQTTKSFTPLSDNAKVEQFLDQRRPAALKRLQLETPDTDEFERIAKVINQFEPFSRELSDDIIHAMDYLIGKQRTLQEDLPAVRELLQGRLDAEPDSHLIDFVITGAGIADLERKHARPQFDAVVRICFQEHRPNTPADIRRVLTDYESGELSEFDRDTLFNPYGDMGIRPIEFITKLLRDHLKKPGRFQHPLLKYVTEESLRAMAKALIDSWK
jgi:hypothetical protein